MGVEPGYWMTRSKMAATRRKYFFCVVVVVVAVFKRPAAIHDPTDEKKPLNFRLKARRKKKKDERNIREAVKKSKEIRDRDLGGGCTVHSSLGQRFDSLPRCWHVSLSLCPLCAVFCFCWLNACAPQRGRTTSASRPLRCRRMEKSRSLKAICTWQRPLRRRSSRCATVAKAKQNKVRLTVAVDA